MRPPIRTAVVAGAGGALGSAVLEQLLALGGFERVHALVIEPITPALRGFHPLPLDGLDAALHIDTGVIVFDRERHANGREAAFLRPQPADALALARAMAAAGVRRLVLVWPHAPASLPEALKHGLATLDEHAIASLPFEQVVFVRSAQAQAGARAASAPARLAAWVLSQLRFMVPTRQQAVRPVQVAAFVAGITRGLQAAPRGTRVAAPERVWQAAQSGDPLGSGLAWLQAGV
jgi:hypothetical protein